MKHLVLCFIVLLFVANSCKPDEIVPPSTDSLSATKMLILNEGNFMWGNASLSLYDLSKDSIPCEDIYQSKNQEAMGDVLQSAAIIDDKIYFVINNSAKIIVVDKNTLVKKQEISGLGSPRYVADGANGYLYVSDIYANEIKVLNKIDGSVHARIPCVGWTEQMVYDNNKIYVANKKSHFIYVISTTSNRIVDSFYVGYGCNALLIDNNHRLWVATDGKSDESILPNISRLNIDGASISLEAKMEWTGIAATALCANKTKDQIYFIRETSVFKMNSIATAIPSTPIISKPTAVFYGLGIEPLSGDVFVADALDYVQRSTIYRYSSDGTQLQASTKAGIISNGFLFGE